MLDCYDRDQTSKCAVLAPIPACIVLCSLPSVDALIICRQHLAQRHPNHDSFLWPYRCISNPYVVVHAKVGMFVEACQELASRNTGVPYSTTVSPQVASFQQYGLQKTAQMMVAHHKEAPHDDEDAVARESLPQPNDKKHKQSDNNDEGFTRSISLYWHWVRCQRAAARLGKVGVRYQHCSRGKEYRSTTASCMPVRTSSSTF